MKNIGKILLVLIITLCAYWLYNALCHWTWENIGASYAMGDLWEVSLFYGFLYLLCFTRVIVFGNSTPRRVAYGSLIALIGGLLPLFSAGIWEYMHTNIPYRQIMALEQGSYPALLLTHGMTLLVVNMLFLLRRYFASRPHAVSA